MASGLAVLVVLALVVALTGTPFLSDRDAKARAAAADAIKALHAGDVAALGASLAAHRGQPDFAYFFTSKAIPRALGDALPALAGANWRAPLKAGVDTHAYDLALTDLAGTLALATHGVEGRALPDSWTGDFIKATTNPATLYGETGNAADEAAKRRADQDVANKQNLLLLLSRGYWSTDFLNAVTPAYWEFDQEEGPDAWPGPVLDAKYAPAPNGAHLTDGVVALTAALTANPEASRWAFTELQPGAATVSYDGADHSIGKFAHYLFLDRFPESSSGEDDSDSIGMTAALTALFSAIDATGGAGEALDTSTGEGPTADFIVLQGLAKSLTDQDDGNLLSKVGDVAAVVAREIWHLIQRRGHTVFDILSSSNSPLGTVAAVANAAWYTIESDYARAGLSLAPVVRRLSFVKKIAKTGVDAVKGAKAAVEVETAA